MDDKPILILGGYGNAGFSIADYVLKISDKKLLLAGRQLDKARFAAGDLNAGYVGQGWDYRVEGMGLDASNAEAVTQACQNASLLIVAAPSTAHIDDLLNSLLASRTDALFISPHPQLQTALEARAAELKQADVCVIAQAGLLPGLPAALIRHYQAELPELSQASISLLRRLDWQAAKPGDDSLRDWLDTWRNTAQRVYRQRQWQDAQAWRGDYPKVKFAEQSRRVACVPQVLPELQIITEHFDFHHLHDLDANINRFNPFINWLVLPFISKAEADITDKLLKRLRWGLETFNQAPSHTQLQAVFHGKAAQKNSGNYKKTLTVHLTHNNAYELAGMAVAACVKQYFDGDLRQPGLWLQGLSVNPAQLLDDMQTFGAKLTVTTEVA